MSEDTPYSMFIVKLYTDGTLTKAEYHGATETLFSGESAVKDLIQDLEFDLESHQNKLESLKND